MNVIDKAFLLKKTALFENLDLDLLLTLSDKMELRHFNGSEQIFRKGQEASQMYVVVSGEIEVDRYEKPELLRTADYFGDEAVFNEKPRRYTATCREKATLLSMTRNHLLSIIAQCPSVAIALLKKYTL
ncbi:MAG: CRP-like cAMP-activated global transcriptional regulator [Chlamydiales bacterium]|nr:CRP-like cAMP-activated global transcriptional regulator [Chlamydiales bacterium]MCH9636124.1 CRP-like cAMP-activated global transcriptional regulator [Chlamydiales bacterium]MCH9703268.1 cyclic nucleotide-binding domain-containing protein [Chlamydiota bacterium]